MKKVLAAVLAVVIVGASFFAGTAVARADTKSDSKAEPISKTSTVEKKTEDKKDADEPENEEEEKELKPKNVFFSPNTGNDSTGDASMYSPVKTLKKAKELAKKMTVAEDEELVYLEYMMTVNVKTQEAAGVFSDAGGVNMIPFTGSTKSYYFNGDIVGTGCDTQKYLPNDGGVLFSARYMLKGKDYKGQECSIFIENNGTALDLCTPTVITDSRALSDWQEYELRSIVVPVAGGVDVNVFRIHKD